MVLGSNHSRLEDVRMWCFKLFMTCGGLKKLSEAWYELISSPMVSWFDPCMILNSFKEGSRQLRHQVPLCLAMRIPGRMVKENTECDDVKDAKAVNQRCKLQTSSISGGQKPQLTVTMQRELMYMVSDLNPFVLVTMAHEQLRTHLRSLCMYVWVYIL